MIFDDRSQELDSLNSEKVIAPERGGHSTILCSTKCICAVAAW